MCGLVGIMSSNMTHKHKEVLASLLYLDTFRGRDSTGVAAIRHNADTDIMKSTVPGYEFTEGDKLFHHLKLNDFVWIGHNRYGTMGKNIKSNSHPFEILDGDGSCLLVGAHNGTLKSKYLLDDHAKFGTDSEALFSQIAHKGLEATIAEVEGAWALTYYDHITEELRFLRNKERPLFYAWEEGRKTIIWASEMWMLRVSCSRFNLKLDEDKVYSVAEDTLYRIPAPDKINEVLTMERKGGLAGKEPAFFQRKPWEPAGGATGGTTQSETKETTTTTSAIEYQPNKETSTSGTTQPKAGENQTPQKVSSLGEVSTLSKEGQRLMALSRSREAGKVVSINSAKSYKGFNGIALTKKEIEDQLANGCGWCELEFITLDEKFAWLAPSKPICHKCLTGEHEDKDLIAAMYQAPSSSTTVSIH